MADKIPLISVLIPVYNIEEYIERCIKSVLEQTYTNLDIVVVNDGSIDKSGFVCERYAKEDKRIKYIVQENAGLVSARKTGLNNATGEYVVFLDGDDSIESDHIETLYYMIQEREVDFVHTNYSINGKNQLFFAREYYFGHSDLTFDIRQKIIAEHVFAWNRNREWFECNIYGSIYKRSFVEECYNLVPNTQSYGEDLICLIHAIMRCKSVSFNPYSGYNYTLREGSLEHQRSFKKVMNNKIELFEEMTKVIDDYELDDFVKNRLRVLFRHKLFDDIFLLNDEYTQVRRKFSCNSINEYLGKKLVLYGAGAVGKDYYNQIKCSGNITIVAWVDKNYNNIHCNQEAISDPKIITTVEFDMILIAVTDKLVAEEIISDLTTMGIDLDMIKWEEPKEEIIVAMKDYDII